MLGYRAVTEEVSGMNPVSHVFQCVRVASLLVVLLAPAIAHGQTNSPVEDAWVTNGPVFALESGVTAAYIGGNFTYVGPNTGCAVRIQEDGFLDTATPLPKVNGPVYAMVSDGADGWYIGGDFTRVGDELRNRVARVLPDGTVDAWNPNINGTVYALAVSADGNTVFAGGSFTRIGILTRRYLASIDADEASPDYGVATGWEPGPDDLVRVMTVSADGLTLFAGGNFSGYLRGYDITDPLNPVLNPSFSADGMVRALALSPDGAILYAGGWMTGHIAALDADSGDVLSGWNPVVNNPVLSIVATNDEVYFGGSFTEVNYLTRNGIAAVDTTSGAITGDWAPEADGWVTALAMSTDGNSVYVGGEFTLVGGEPRHKIGAVDAVGINDGTGRATTWDAGAGNTVYTLTAVFDGMEYIYAGGAFTTVNGVVRHYLAALDAATASPDYGKATPWNPDLDNIVYALALSADETTVFAGGAFTAVGGGAAAGLAAINAADGSLVWDAGVAGGAVRALVLAPDGSELCAGGEFTDIGGQPRNRIAKINPGTGAVTLGWNPDVNGVVHALAMSDIVVYAGGEFTDIDGSPRSYIAALERGGTGSPTSWTVDADYPVLSLALTSAFDILYAGGNFTTIGAQARARAAALDTVDPGAVLPWAHPGFDGAVNALMLLEAQNILIAGGNFVSPAYRLAAIKSDSGIAEFGLPINEWKPDATNPVYAFTLARDLGSFYAGGAFTGFGGSFSGAGNRPRSYLAQFSLADDVPPVITLLGDNPQTIECGDPYVELGATAYDNWDGDLSGAIVIDASAVDTSTVGSYTVTYNVSDSASNAATEVTRTVDVVDTTPPVITLNGSDPETVECGDAYADAGATAADACDGDLTALIVVGGDAVDTGTVGAYVLTYNVSDAATNAAVEVTRAVNVVDTTPPVITVVGDNPATVECGDTYMDAGATAADICDGDLTSLIVVDDSAVDTSAVGSFVITYNVSDAATNAAVEATRMVNVVDTTAPVITLLGADPQYVELNTVYNELGATAADACDGDISALIVIDAGAVDVATVGTYVVTYNVSDGAANGATEETRTVIVQDTAQPFVVSVAVQTAWTVLITFNKDMGANVLDPASYTASGPGAGTLPVNPDSVTEIDPANYLLTWSCPASMTNGQPLTITVGGTVEDIYGNLMGMPDAGSDTAIATLPAITVGGANPITVECGDAYTDAGATAVDQCGADISASIVTTNPVDTGTPGTYMVSYDVADTAGNASVETRTVNVVDTAAPAITLLGDNPATVECGDVYADAGATAADICDGDLTAAIVVGGDAVDTGVLGAYTITYNVSDAATNAAVEVTRAVNVVDTTSPALAVLGDNPATVECGDAYVDAGATAADVCDGDLTGSIVVGGDAVDTGVLGAYTITYNVSDASTNAAVEATRVVNVVDTTAPVITLLGSDPETVECGDAYADAGATAADVCDGDLTVGIVVGGDAVDTGTVGAYVITYNVSDASTNAAVEVTRTVNVVDTTAPVITLLGDAVVDVECGDAYTDAGATAADVCDGDLTAGIVVTDPVNPSAAGSYTVFYNVSDTASNAAVEVTRVVNVVDTTVPVITLLGNDPETVECGVAYVDAGATAADVCDGDLTAAIVVANPVDTGVLGAYTITYNVSDASTNAAVEATRIVNVVDTTAPVITLLGDAVVDVECGNAYVDAGATAFDDCDGDLTGSIVVGGDAVDTGVLGAYTITYNV
ncbi:MAG TPA: DUF5011 domain-containing protein, partial [Candidatus Hydrogenedentes bacterium]|nr:DUF5011 domain-containing protein [Candidatus Hydrogenedentota bacterium]